MAKGNDGNLLQHTLECALAQELSRDRVRGLHLVCTHAMNPFEPFDEPRHSPHKLIDAALALAEHAVDDALPVVQAYHVLGASAQRYPNSSDLIAALLGDSTLRGCLVEVDNDKSQRLERRWRDRPVKIFRGSWRKAVRLGGLSCPDPLDRPWLLTMDPMSFCRGPGSDDCRLYQADLHRMSATCESYLRSCQPGAVLLFCYSMRRHLSPWTYQYFYESIIQWRRLLGAGHLGFVETSSPNPSVCAVLATHAGLLREGKRAWSKVQDLARSLT
jgi:hypothetical protein